MRHFIFFVVLILAFSSCKKDEDIGTELDLSDELQSMLETASPTGDANFFKMPSESDLANIPQDPKNALTTQKVELGKLLYHETGIALAPMQAVGKGTYSCASCHFAEAGFQAGRWQGIGEGGSGIGVKGEGRAPILSMYTGEELDVQPIRSPSAMNGAWQEATLWNGQFGGTGINIGTESSWEEGTPKKVNHLGYEGLESQAIAGLEVHRMVIDPAVVDTLGYKEMFDNAFGDWPTDERYSREAAGLAIAAYERTLLATRAPFQQWLKGDQMALSEQELRGALVFFDLNKGNCVSCHTGPALNSMEFHGLGMNDLHLVAEDVFKVTETSNAVNGRGGFTGRSEDMFKFKVPQLYNLSDSPFFGHGSSFRSVKAVVEYKNEAVAEKSTVPQSQLAAEFVPLGLTTSEINDLTAFLESALHDPDLKRFVPDALPSGNCFPFNDEASRSELGCN